MAQGSSGDAEQYQRRRMQIIGGDTEEAGYPPLPDDSPVFAASAATPPGGNAGRQTRPLSSNLVLLVAFILILALVFLGILFLPGLRSPATPTPGMAAGYGKYIRANTLQLNFPALAPGEVSTQTIVVGNTGATPVDMPVFRVIGENPTVFRVASDCYTAPLPPGTRCLIQIAFAPDSPGAQSATLFIGEEGPQIALSGAKVAALSAIPSTRPFGQILDDTGAIPQSVLLVNSGEIPVTINQIRLDGPARNDFYVTLDLCSHIPLNPREQCQVTLGFLPSRPGEYQADLIIGSRVLPTPFVVPLSGAGITPTPTATSTPIPTATPTTTSTATPTPTPTGTLIPNLLVSPTSLDFGPRPINTDSVARSAELTNAGPVNLTINDVTLAGANPADFRITANSCSGVSLGVSARCSLSFVFRPTATGNRQADVIIRHTGGNSPQLVRLQGVGQ